jgi:hypothetical protein
MTPTLLDTEQMANFVARGFLAFRGLVDDDLNVAAMAELDQILATWGSDDRPFAPSSGERFDVIYPEPSAIGAVLRHPVVAGAVHSLVGLDAVFDHDFVHLRPPGDLSQQKLHADAIIDPNLAFDIQIFYFPHEIAEGGGGTGFVPGTHLRRVNETDVARYHHVAGERQWTGPAGSVVIFHHGMWHRGMPNPGSSRRLMYKVRLNPTAPQVRLWDLAGFDERQNDASDHVFAKFRADSVAAALRHREQWLGESAYRLELVRRAELWRYLSGDSAFDVDWYQTRQELRAELA